MKNSLFSFKMKSQAIHAEVEFVNCSDDIVKDTRAGALVVCDENTKTLADLPGTDSVVLRAGEKHKNMQSVQKILEAAVKNGLGRDSVFIAVGGGVVCDITGFAASIYMRGCRLILYPTSLLAMVDASLGGKTGVDFMGYKNMAGTFCPAERIFINPGVLDSLPDREFLCGLAEVIKSALLKPGPLLSILKTDSKKILTKLPETINRVISESIKIKGSYITADFKEQGIRSHLNLGHTFAHSLESVTGFSGPNHGEAVAWGILCALRAGVIMGKTQITHYEQVKELLNTYGFSIKAEGVSPEELFNAFFMDKKKKDGVVRFIIQHRAGETSQMQIPDEVIRQVLIESIQV